MRHSRRTFLRGLSTAAVTSGFVAARGREALVAFWPDAETAALEPGGPIILASNENPLGPSERALAAIRDVVAAKEPGRYPDLALSDLQSALAAVHGVKPENVLLGCGSSQILRTVTQLYTGPSRALVTALPTYEACTRYAELIGSPVRALPLDATLRIDLEATLAAAKGAGLVYFNNPNNPTATLHGARAVDDFVERLAQTSPETTILIDEAYHDYVTDPAHRTQIPRAAASPHVIVSRTFSKAHGMAGLRIGYAVAHAQTIEDMTRWDGPLAVNCLGLAGALASLSDPARLRQEAARNTEARSFTVDALKRMGYASTDSQGNFVFVDIGRPASAFRESCAKQGVLVARDFAPFEKTHCRISIGTLDEMKRAAAVFEKVLFGLPPLPLASE